MFPLKHLAFLAGALAVALLAGGCARPAVFDLDPDFSMNVAKASLNERNVPTLSPAQKEIHDKYGAPDFMRFLWTSQGDLTGKTQRLSFGGKKPAGLERTWIYLQRSVEVYFKGRKDYDIRPLSDSIRIVCEQGDPEEIVEHRENPARPYSDYIYYKKGMRYKIDADGRLAQRLSFPRMGQ